MTSARNIDQDQIGLPQSRSLERQNGVSDMYPVSCRLYSQSFPEGVSAEVINYHYGGACIRFLDEDVFRIRHMVQYSLQLDFFLGNHLLKSGVPVSVAWQEQSIPNVLGLQFLIETRDFIERSRRYGVNEAYQPTVTAKDPLDIHRTLYFKVRNFSSAGLLLSTSLTNKHLFPGMTLKKAQLSIPGQPQLELDLKLENARKGDLENAFELGVSIQNDGRDFRRAMQTYMSHLVKDASFSDSIFAADETKKRSQVNLASGLTFKIIQTEEDYQDVLKLRLAGYGFKGKVKSGSSLHEQGDGLKNEGTVLGAYLGGKLVASMELRFGASDKPFRVFNFVEKSAFEHLELDYSQMVEMNKLVIHPDAQGSDVVIGMIQKAHAICLTKGALDVMLFATDALKEMYLKIGAREVGVNFPHPYLKEVTLYTLLLTKDAFLEGRFMKAEIWTRYYEETNKFYEQELFKNRRVAPKKIGIVGRLRDFTQSTDHDKSLDQVNYTFVDKGEGNFIDPKWTKQHFVASVIIVYLMAGDRLIGSAKVDEILSDLGVPRSYFRSQNNWISVEFLDAFLDAYSRYGCIDEVSRVSGKLTMDREVIGLNYYLMRHVLSPEFAFKALVSSLKKFNRTRTYEVDVSPGKCILKIGLVSKDLLPKHRCADLNWLENTKTYINILTKDQGEVRQLASPYDGDSATIFDVTWPVRSPRQRFVAALLVNVFSAISIGMIVGFFGGYVTGFASAMAMSLSLVSVKLFFENKRHVRNMNDVTRRIEEINEDNAKKYQDLQNAKQRLDKRYIEAQFLDESARSIQSKPDLRGITQTALKTVCHKFGFERAFIMVLDETRQFLKPVAVEGVSDGAERIWQFKVDVSVKREQALFLSSAFHSGQSVVINDLKAHIFQLNEQSQTLIKAIGGASGFAIVPIPAEAGSNGVLIAERDTIKDPIRQEDIVLLQRMCQHLGIAIERFAKLDKEKKLRTLFQKYVPQAVLDSLLNEETPMLGGEQKEIVCMFLDIRGFTRLSSTLPPKIVIDLLNRVFAVVTKEVEVSGGVVDKFLGDGVLAIWGSVPGSHTDVEKVLNAVAAIETSLASLNKSFVREGIPPVAIGIGLHKGSAIVGNVGSDERLEFTCIGPAVNLASRLEGMCKSLETHLVISEETFPALVESEAFERVEDVAIRGLEKPINVFVPRQSKTNLKVN